MNRLISTALALLLGSFALFAEGYRTLVVPVEFSDVHFSDKTTEVDKKVARMQQYFNDQFSPDRIFSFDIHPTIRLSRERYWYGANSTVRKDERIDQLVRDACALITRDISIYDNNGDGYIEALCFIAAGGSEADGAGVECFWPQQLNLRDRGGTISQNGKTVDCFMICAEASPLGTFCHEFAHTFGLMDLYDTDSSSSGGTSKGVWGSISLMDGGLNNDGGNTPPNFCAVELEQLGIGTPVELRSGYQTLHPVSRGKEYLRIDSDTEGEYFLLECRDNSGWDAAIGGKGLLIYHVDRSGNNSWYSDFYKHNLTAAERWQYNQVNCRPDHMCARILEALPGTRELPGIFFPQEDRNSFGSQTDPAFRYWSGETSTIVIEDIELRDDGSVSFNLFSPIIMREVTVFQDAVIFTWTADNSIKVRDCEISWSGGKSQKVKIQADGNYNAIVEGLEPSTAYTFVVKLNCEDGSAHTVSRSITTKSRISGARPYIYLSFMKRLSDGSFPAGERFPMRVYNASNVASVDWFFNNKYIYPDSDGFWRLTESGTLKARVLHTDGSVDIIIKEITVR